MQEDRNTVTSYLEEKIPALMQRTKDGEVGFFEQHASGTVYKYTLNEQLYQVPRPLLFPVFSATYYSQNYSGIIRPGLTLVQLHMSSFRYKSIHLEIHGTNSM